MTLGDSPPRVDAPAKVRGAARYPADLRAGDRTCLFAKIVFSGRAHARLRALDTARAAAQPGVVAVLTAADVPVNEYGLCRRDQPVLVGFGAPTASVPDPAVSRWEGDAVAVVVAETEARACAAAEWLRMDWEPLPVVTGVDDALRDRTLVHPEHPARSNTFHAVPIRRGALTPEVWDACDVVVSGRYVVPHQEHAYLQPEAALAYTDDAGRLTVETAGQWAHDDRTQIAAALDLPVERVRVRYAAIGGAFGGREDASVQIPIALAAHALAARGDRRAVRTVWSREESILGHHKGHWVRVATRWGAERSGRLRAVEARVELDAGGYASTSEPLLRNALTYIAGPYDVEHVRADGVAVYTHNPPTGAFRGFGAPQACFAAEMQMSKLASALGADPVALRRINALRPGGLGVHQSPMPEGFALVEAIDACAALPVEAAPAVAGFRSLPAEARAIRRGVGFACGFKNVGYSFATPERCEAAIELEGTEGVERAVLRCAAADCGQGAHTALLQMAAEATGVPLARWQLDASDTATSGDSGSASASRLVLLGGHAVQRAAQGALDAWRRGERPARGESVFRPEPTQALHPDSGAARAHVTYGVVAERVELAVDVETGHLAIGRIACAHDVGRAVHPEGVRGQIEGGLVQALGGAVFERLVVRDGRIANPRLSEYTIPGIGDAPARIESIALETPDPAGPWGARGVGEMPFVPLAAAVAAALHDATGVWLDELPLTPERIVAALAAAGVGPESAPR